MADDLKGFAEQVGEDVGDIRRRVATVRKGQDTEFAVVDEVGRPAFGVGPDGAVRIGATTHREAAPGYRIVDEVGAVALEITPGGRTRIHDLEASTVGVSELHPFLAVGQSNMTGPGIEGDRDELDPPDPRIFQYGANRRRVELATVPLDMHTPSSGLSPATTFAREYLKTQPAHVGVLLIPAGRGGTNFTTDPGAYTWNHAAAVANGEPDRDLWQLSMDQALEALDADERCTGIKGILWHQGEGSGSEGFEGYATRIDTLISDYRDGFEAPDVPFLVGQMNRESLTSPGSPRWVIDQAHKAVPGRVLRTAFAPAIPDGGRFGDKTHYSREAVEALGVTYEAAYRRALVNTPDSLPLIPQAVTAQRVNGTVTVEWDAPFSRVTGYRVEYDQGDGWVDAPRAYPMDLAETITGLDPVPTRLRVTAVHDSTESAPSTPIYAIGA